MNQKFKVATVTFHRVNNPGAILQAYALNKYLNMFIDSCLLDYRCEKLEYQAGHKRRFKKRIKDFLKLFLRHEQIYPMRKKRRKYLLFSKKYINKSKKYTYKNIKKANACFDAFIAGSDQIWNPKWSNCDYTYFLSFADNAKRFSYAASFGAKKIDPNYVERCSQELKKFQMILIREETGFEILRNLGFDVSSIKRVCDPVFLLSKNEWINSFKLNEHIFNYGKYIFLYFAANPSYSTEFAKKLAKEKNLKIIYFNAFGFNNIDDDFINLNDGGPIDFLKLLFNAEYVVTTSFHAMAFSLLLNKQFFYELNQLGDNDNSRLENLANIFGVQNCEIKDSSFYDAKWDWCSINKNIIDYSNQSKEIVQKMISLIKEK